MWRIPKSGFGILVGLVSVGCVSGGASQDSFLQVNLKQLPEYRRIWTAKLEPTPFDCGRFVSLPAFDPDSSVSVYRYRRDDGTSGYRVTYIAASDNIWQITEGVLYPDRAKAIKTRRFDADIPESTAQLLRGVWLRILSGSHPTEATTRRDLIPIDPPYFEWSLQLPNAAPLRARANWYVTTTPTRKRFADLPAVTLAAYCKADVRERPKIARQIQKDAADLLKITTSSN